MGGGGGGRASRESGQGGREEDDASSKNRRMRFGSNAAAPPALDGEAIPRPRVARGGGKADVRTLEARRLRRGVEEELGDREVGDPDAKCQCRKSERRKRDESAAIRIQRRGAGGVAQGGRGLLPEAAGV